jgi:hypothetical protein
VGIIATISPSPAAPVFAPSGRGSFFALPGIVFQLGAVVAATAVGTVVVQITWAEVQLNF